MKAELKEPAYYSTVQIAAHAAVTRQTVQHWIKNGVYAHGRQVKLRAERLGKHWRVPVEAWEEFRQALNPDVELEKAGAKEAQESGHREAVRRLEKAGLM